MQAVEQGVAVLHIISEEHDRPAGLALISTMRKRLRNLPSADEEWRVRMHSMNVL